MNFSADGMRLITSSEDDQVHIHKHTSQPDIHTHILSRPGTHSREHTHDQVHTHSLTTRNTHIVSRPGTHTPTHSRPGTHRHNQVHTHTFTTRYTYAHTHD